MASISHHMKNVKEHLQYRIELSDRNVGINLLNRQTTTIVNHEITTLCNMLCLHKKTNIAWMDGYGKRVRNAMGKHR